MLYLITAQSKLLLTCIFLMHMQSEADPTLKFPVQNNKEMH